MKIAHSNRFTAVLLRQLGFLLSILSLGIGFAWSLFSRYKQTWADLISHSYIVERKSITVIAKGNQDSNIFTDGTLLGNFNEVPLEYRAFSTLIDLLAVGLLWFTGVALLNINQAKLYLLEPIILQAEEFQLDGYYVKDSYHSSGGAFAIARRTHPAPKLTTTFSGPSGAYNVRIAFWGSGSYSNEIEVSIGNNKAKYSTFGSEYLIRVPIFTDVRINEEDSITISSAAGINRHEKIDYLEFSPIENPEIFLAQDNLGRLHRILFHLGISDISLATHIFICVGLYLPFYLIAITMGGVTFGTTLMGFCISKRDIPLSPPNFPETLWRAAALVEQHLIYLVSFFRPTPPESHLLEQSNTATFFLPNDS